MLTASTISLILFSELSPTIGAVTAACQKEVKRKLLFLLKIQAVAICAME